MENTISVVIFLLIAFLITLVFCFISQYFIRHNKVNENDDNPLEENFEVAKQKNNPYFPKQQMNNDGSPQVAKLRPTNKLNLSRFSETENLVSKRLLSQYSKESKNTSFRNPFDLSGEGSGLQADLKKNLKHQYISKLANYTPNGIQLYEKQLFTIKLIKIFKNLRWVEEVKENFTMNKEFYPANIENFEEILDIIKFQQGQYGAIKFVTQFQIRACQQDKEYNVNLLTKNERFQLISIQEFNEELTNLQSI